MKSGISYKGIKVLGLLLLFVIGCSLSSFSQGGTHYTLDKLIHAACVNYPYASQLGLNESGRRESVKDLGMEWLPQVSVTGKTSYQSEVSSLKIPESVAQRFGLNIGGGEKWQYQGTVSVSQLLYDGGLNRTEKQLARTQSDIKSYQIKSSMLQIEDNVDHVFESILLNKEQIKMVRYQQKDLELRKKDICTAVQNGIALKTSSQEIDADLIQLQQQETSLRMQLCQDFVQLSSFTRLDLDTTTVLGFPKDTAVVAIDYTGRPDYQIFGSQILSSELSEKKLNQAFIPQLSFFANGYYGRPGLNVMDFSSHYSGLVGISLKWNIASLYDNVHKKNIERIHRDLIKNDQSLFEINMDKQIKNLLIDQAKNRKLLDSDDRVVAIRLNVKDVAAVQLKNGSITLTDYMIKLNDVSQAMINKSIHRIELSMDRARMKTLLDKNNAE
jgi:outer membrane protein TolC